jgi:hypothetical protein
MKAELRIEFDYDEYMQVEKIIAAIRAAEVSFTRMTTTFFDTDEKAFMTKEASAS